MLEEIINKKTILVWAMCVGAVHSEAMAADTGYFMPSARAVMSKTRYQSSDRASALTTAALLPVGRGFDLSITARALPQPFSKPSMQSILRRIGPITVERTDSSPIAMEHGVTTTFAMPLTGIPGLDLTANFFAGHRDTRLGAPPGSAAFTGGIRWRW